VRDGCAAMTRAALSGAALLVPAAALPVLAQQWTATTPLPDGYYGQALVAASGRLYHVGGISGANGIPDGYHVFQSQITSGGGIGTWVQAPSLPEAVGLHGAVIAAGTIYVVGGYAYEPVNGTYVADHVVSSRIHVDGSLGEWQTVSTLPAPAYWLGVTEWHGRIYVSGGTNGGQDFDGVYSSIASPDGNMGPWRTEAPLVEAVYAHAMVAAEGALYVIGGYIHNGSLNTRAVYYSVINPDGTLGPWTETTQLPVAISSCEAVALCASMFLLDGFNGNSALPTCHHTSILADHSLGPWSPLPNLPHGAFQPGMAVSEQVAYVSGGSDFQDVYSSVVLLPLASYLTGPTLTQQPAPASACSSGSATFSIAASGAGLTYQWQIQTAPPPASAWADLSTGPLPLPCGGWVTAVSPTAVQTSISITPCPGVYAYQVRCVVTSDCGSATSDEATYTVCFANCDCSTVSPTLNVADFGCFLQKYAAGDPYANCDASTQPPTLNVADFSCFLQKYAAGCP